MGCVIGLHIKGKLELGRTTTKETYESHLDMTHLRSGPDETGSCLHVPPGHNRDEGNVSIAGDRNGCAAAGSRARRWPRLDTVIWKTYIHEKDLW